ncbi:MAG: DUF2442 domain-containing protein [Chlorobiaceae bacterium]|jgi:hypothetical protein|nr:DUF2442 domain-containing protein [Chlorobiaceae bacterium]
MYFSIIQVKPLDDYQLLLKFENDENRIFDVRSFLEVGKYSELKNVSLFSSVRTSFDSIQWANELDFDPGFFYVKSTLLEE